MRAKRDTMWSLLVPLIFMWGVCAVGIIVVILDTIFNLGLSTR